MTTNLLHMTDCRPMAAPGMDRGRMKEVHIVDGLLTKTTVAGRGGRSKGSIRAIPPDRIRDDPPVSGAASSVVGTNSIAINKTLLLQASNADSRCRLGPNSLVLSCYADSAPCSADLISLLGRLRNLHCELVGFQ